MGSITWEGFRITIDIDRKTPQIMMRTVKNVLVIHFDLEKLRKKRVQHLYMSPFLLLTETYNHYHSLTYQRNPQDVINIDKKTLNLSLHSTVLYAIGILGLSSF